MHISAKILSMKRSLRVSFVSQCTTSLSECAVTGSIFGGAFISRSRAVTAIDGTGYIVSPLDDVNGARRAPLCLGRCPRHNGPCPFSVGHASNPPLNHPLPLPPNNRTHLPP